ncbi:MAG: MerR family transcriptional regulator [Chitinivibrionales bacterium]|nr:MerR family transcriptional regulator [Chitinivibrionales bacterium]
MPRKLNVNKPYFSIGAVAEILNIQPRMLRLYEERGLITPSRTEGNRRLYSLKDIDVLAYIHYLGCVKRVNIAGIIEIQKLLHKLDDKTRNEYLEEIEKEIEDLPSEKKKAYSGEDKAFSEVVIKEAEEYVSKVTDKSK